MRLIERLALSSVSSISISISIGFTMYYLGIPIAQGPVLYTLTLFCIVLCYLALRRRVHEGGDYRPPTMNMMVSRIRPYVKGQGSERLLVIGCTALLVASLIVVSLNVADPPNSKRYSTLYLLNNDGLSSEFPHNMAAGETISFQMGIINHEGRTVHYTAQVWLVGMNSTGAISEIIYYQEFSTVLPSVVPPVSDNFEKQSETRLDVTIDRAGDYRVWVILHKDMLDSPNLVPGQDYAGTSEEEIIEMARSNHLENVYLSITVTE